MTPRPRLAARTIAPKISAPGKIINGHSCNSVLVGAIQWAHRDNRLITVITISLVAFAAEKLMQ
jgi:hypothetical protein